MHHTNPLCHRTDAPSSPLLGGRIWTWIMGYIFNYFLIEKQQDMESLLPTRDAMLSLCPPLSPGPL